MENIFECVVFKQKQDNNPELNTRFSALLRPDFSVTLRPTPLYSETGGGLESSGQRLISSIIKTKRTAFLQKKNLKIFQILKKKKSDFF